nr:MAG TPA: hypothetical protein [Caudoviricetes sp.]
MGLEKIKYIMKIKGLTAEMLSHVYLCHQGKELCHGFRKNKIYNEN